VPGETKVRRDAQNVEHDHDHILVLPDALKSNAALSARVHETMVSITRVERQPVRVNTFYRPG